MGIPKVGLFCFETSGLFLSRPPGVFSHATAPHMLPLHCATRIGATLSATIQSPVGSADDASPGSATRAAPQQKRLRMVFSGRCNMFEPYALVGRWALGGKTPHCLFSVDEPVTNRS